MRGIGGNTSNSIKELVSNESLSSNMDWLVFLAESSYDNETWHHFFSYHLLTLIYSAKHTKSVLVMDEVDGMSAGDRGGVADLIASIKISKIPIICICNDRYSQKLKSLVNYCLLLNFRKPTKQQVFFFCINVPIFVTSIRIVHNTFNSLYASSFNFYFGLVLHPIKV